MTKLSISLKSYEKVLQAKFDAAKAGITDTAVKGSANEQIIANFLKKSVPNWSVSINSQIIDSHDNSSDELDICICNDYQFLLQQKGDVLIAEGVDFVVQVKATLTDEELNRTIKNCVKVKHLKRNIIKESQVYYPANMGHDWPDFIPYFCFVFSSQLKPETIAERLNKKSSEIDLRHQIDALCVLDRGVSLVNCTRNSRCKPEGGDRMSGWVALETGEATLLEFVRNCIDYVPRIRYPHPPIAKYFPESPGYRYIGGGKRPYASSLQSWGC